MGLLNKEIIKCERDSSNFIFAPDKECFTEEEAASLQPRVAEVLDKCWGEKFSCCSHGCRIPGIVQKINDSLIRHC